MKRKHNWQKIVEGIAGISGMSDNQLAKTYGIASQATWSRWRRGQGNGPQDYNYKRLSALLEKLSLERDIQIVQNAIKLMPSMPTGSGFSVLNENLYVLGTTNVMTGGENPVGKRIHDLAAPGQEHLPPLIEKLLDDPDFWQTPNICVALPKVEFADDRNPGETIAREFMFVSTEIEGNIYAIMQHKYPFVEKKED